MVDIAVILGADPERAKTELRESLEFEIKLANVSDHPLAIDMIYIGEISTNKKKYK